MPLQLFLIFLMYFLNFFLILIFDFNSWDLYSGGQKIITLKSNKIITASELTGVLVVVFLTCSETQNIQ